MMVINNKFNIWQIVYLKTDCDQYPRIVVSLELFDGGAIMYKLGCADEISRHYEFELSKKEDMELSHS